MNCMSVVSDDVFTVSCEPLNCYSDEACEYGHVKNSTTGCDMCPCLQPCQVGKLAMLYYYYYYYYYYLYSAKSHSAASVVCSLLRSKT